MENDLIWQQIMPLVLKENRSGNEIQEAGLKTYVKECYDDNTLYFFFMCNTLDI
ncbi:hypothetical protein SAMN04488008_10127 [Maribacter orientalis]|uniref:Uncharacterized protein n=1 Tax=Maribacter orientalis TaxID=228957 RepID=A0A1H7F1B4_9FLAO|nr:hypothetical protein [Maribacter orientalis]SEK19788.1 hypothetical protein SAMN04488008_10127 [Maribacter orientalis]